MTKNEKDITITLTKKEAFFIKNLIAYDKMERVLDESIEFDEKLLEKFKNAWK